MKNIADTQTAICIAGAHRSGTSMLTRLLHACGLYLGKKNELMPPQADNPDGFWEHLGFVALNDELLNALGGAWDLPPKADETFTRPELDTLRLKARLLIEGFDSAHVWGWKDPRNSLTLQFWQDLLPGLKTLIMVRNPLEVAYSMRERNGTSYAFGLRLWEIYNRRLIELAGKHDRLVTHYDLFFENAEKELQRIANFIGLPSAKIRRIAKLVVTKRRHTHFTIDQLIDARVSGEVIELYRALTAETSGSKASVAKSGRRVKSTESDILPGSVSRLDAFIPDRFAQIEHLYGELLAQTEARHKREVEKLSAHTAHTEAQHKAQVKELTTHLAHTEARHKSEIEKVSANAARMEEGYKAQIEKLKNHLTHTEAQHKSQVTELTTHLAHTEARHKSEIEKVSANAARMEEGYKAQIEKLKNHLTHTEAQHKSQVKELTTHLAHTEARHKSEIEKLSANAARMEERYKAQIEKLKNHLTHTEAQHKSQVKELTTHLAHTEAQHKAQVEKVSANAARMEERYKAQIEKLKNHLAHTEAQHNAQVKELTTHLAHTEAQHKAQVEKVSANAARMEEGYKAQIEKLKSHLAHTEAQHKAQVEKVSANAARMEERYKAQIEKLKNHLAHTEAQHNAQVKELTTHLAHTEAQHNAQVKELTTHLAHTEAQHNGQVKELTTHLAHTEEQYIAQIEEISAHLVKTEAAHKAQVEELIAGHEAEVKQFNAVLAQLEDGHKAQVEEITTHYTSDVEQLRQRIMEMNGLLHQRSVNLAEDEKYIAELTDRLRKQLHNTRRLSRLLDDTDDAARKLRTSRRWQLANPGATLKAKLARRKAPAGYGHLERIVAAYSKWRKEHPEIKKIDDDIKDAQVAKVPRRGQPGTDGQAPAIAPREEVLAAPVGPVSPLTAICFPQHEEVDVSIIIPVFNQFEYTHACLASLQAVQEQPPFEVIVVDDCSTDGTPEVIAQIPGVVYQRNDSNSGFIASCNTGAKMARGKYLVFLNNDTLVKPGWLTALLDTFKEERRAGIVGSKLLYPDGRLQEAGGIIWQDASGWNYGKFDDPGKPEYNYLRDVDYCSAAALMIPKALFESAGGFDSRYAPGYYEDTDLAFKVRQAGYRVLYQPLSEVIHHEGATGGTDISTGAKKHQEINRSTFAEVWSDELTKRPANGDVTFLQRPRTPSGKNILVIDHHLPMPDRDSGSLRMFQILKILHRLGHRVTFLPDNLADMPPYTHELQKRGIQVVHHPYVKRVRDYLISHGPMFDVVVLSRCDFARKHIADVRLHAPQSRIIFDTVDLHYLREQREAQLTQDPDVRRKAQERQELEDYLIKEADETWVVSPIEQQMLQENWPHKSIQLVSNIVDVTGPVTPFALRRDWLFIGGFQHRPNIDAVLFFVEEIYPLIRDRLPDTKFYIIGDKAPPEIVALASDRIIVAGLQRNVRSFFDSVRLSVAPLRFGAGIKGKINQSMAFGVPVVATSIAVEGMNLIDHEHVLVADEPQDFARALIELYESEELWKRLSQNGISKTQELYSTDAAREKLEFLFSDRHLKSLEPSQSVAEHELVAAADVGYRQ